MEETRPLKCRGFLLPMKKDAYYFSHDANAQDDHKCMTLIDQLGMEGYGIFWALIEKLRSEKGYKLPISVSSVYAKRWSTSKEKIETVITKYGLFAIEDDVFFSLRLISSMTEKSEKARLSANYRWGKDANALQSHTERNANGMLDDAIKVKESKVKEKKVKKVFIPPSVEDVKSFFKENGYTEQAGEKAFKYYDEANWHDSKGSAVISWKQKMRGIWFKDENKQTHSSQTGLILNQPKAQLQPRAESYD